MDSRYVYVILEYTVVTFKSNFVVELTKKRMEFLELQYRFHFILCNYGNVFK